MNYRGYSILKRCDGLWCVIIDYYTEFLATSKDDAKTQVDEYIESMHKRTEQAA